MIRWLQYTVVAQYSHRSHKHSCINTGQRCEQHITCSNVKFSSVSIRHRYVVWTQQGMLYIISTSLHLLESAYVLQVMKMVCKHTVIAAAACSMGVACHIHTSPCSAPCAPRSTILVDTVPGTFCSNTVVNTQYCTLMKHDCQYTVLHFIL